MRRARPGAGSIVLACALVLAFVAAGCSQEGKTIETPLIVQGVAWDATVVGAETGVVDPGPPAVTDTVAALLNVQFKIQSVYTNGCERLAGIELKAEGSASDPIYVITPLARYTADQDCNVGAAGDTVKQILITNLRVPISSRIRVEIRGGQPVPLLPTITPDLASFGDTSIVYSIRVEDKTTGAFLENATVRVEDSGASLLAEGPTNSEGVYSFEQACANSTGVPEVAYVVKVSYDGRTTVLRLQGFPALCNRREQVIVRV